MSRRPHDRADLFLAPVALEVDERMRELGTMSLEELNLRVALAANVDTRFAGERERGLLATVTHLIDLHDWVASWDDCGVRLSHGGHHITLAPPANFSTFRAAEYAPIA